MWRRLLALGGSAVFLLGCVHGVKAGTVHHGSPVEERMQAPSECATIEQFTRFEFSRGREAKPVYQYGTGPGVLILHEIDGLTPETLCLAKSIGDKGYSVFLPAFFGEAGQEPGGALVRTLRRVSICAGHDFCCFCKEQSSPVVGWLRELLPEIGKRAAGKGIGVIGMCLTGSFPIALMDDPAVKVVVMSQPSLPLAWTASLKPALGLSEPEIRNAKRRSMEVEMLAFRFADDSISPPEKLETLKELFGDRIAPETFPQGTAQKHSHAVLTASFVPEALELVLKALRRGLR
jgi:dienelactone hydrolase